VCEVRARAINERINLDMQLSFFHQMPFTVVFVIVLTFLLIALEVGYRIGLKQRDAWKNANSGGGAVALTSLFALMGLILAFTYASGVNRYEVRKQAVISESNALGTAFLRAGFIAEPGGRQIKEKLLAYAYSRLMPLREGGVVFSDEERAEYLKNTLYAQGELWPTMEKALGDKNLGPMDVSMVTAINDVLDQHTIRIAALFNKLPEFILWMLVFIAGSTIAVTGFNAGLSGKMSRWRTAALTLVISSVMMTIIDFDRPSDGFARVGQRSLVSVVADMEADLMR